MSLLRDVGLDRIGHHVIIFFFMYNKSSSLRNFDYVLLLDYYL